MQKYVLSIASARDNAVVGLTASNLCYLKNAGFKIPQTYVCAASAYEGYSSGNDGVLANLRTELGKLLRKDKKYSIKPSVSLADGKG